VNARREPRDPHLPRELGGLEVHPGGTERDERRTSGDPEVAADGTMMVLDVTTEEMMGDPGDAVVLLPGVDRPRGEPAQDDVGRLRGGVRLPEGAVPADVDRLPGEEVLEDVVLRPEDLVLDVEVLREEVEEVHQEEVEAHRVAAEVLAIALLVATVAEADGATNRLTVVAITTTVDRQDVLLRILGAVGHHATIAVTVVTTAATTVAAVATGDLVLAATTGLLRDEMMTADPRHAPARMKAGPPSNVSRHRSSRRSSVCIKRL